MILNDSEDASIDRLSALFSSNSKYFWDNSWLTEDACIGQLLAFLVLHLCVCIYLSVCLCVHVDSLLLVQLNFGIAHLKGLAKSMPYRENTLLPI